MDEELAAGAKQREDVRGKSLDAAKSRDRLLEQFAADCARLQGVWKPRLEAFAKKFGDSVHVTPKVSPTQRDVAMSFRTGLAAVNLRLVAGAAVESGNLVLDYTLDIVPILMDYERAARLEQPIGKVDAKAVGDWIDDRLIAFLKTYHAMFANEAYLASSMVEDPVAHVRFPKHVAAASIERGGKTVYFVSAETKATYESSQAGAPPPPAASKPSPAATPARPGDAASATPAKGPAPHPPRPH